ncbi:MAG: lysylphosphatidylglycerol synthase transmembrane domain-containing protein, partial [Candidatus Saccharimonadales bacterium]
LIVNVVTITALLVLLFLIRGQIVDTFNNLHKVNLWVIALMLPLQVLNYHAQTKVYQHLFALVGNKLKYGPVFRVALELNFVNHVFPSGGVSGISFFGLRLRGANITGGKATLVQIMKLGLMFVSFEILLLGGLLVMSANGRTNNLVILAAGSISTLLVVGTFAFVYVFGSARRIHSTFSLVTKGLNSLIRIARPRKPDAISIERVERVALEFHNNYKVIESKYRELKAPFWWALVINVTEVLSVYVVYVAFGQWVNLGAIILAYAVANFAGLVSVLPGGIGIYEALMTGVLAAAGVPAALSLPVTVMFRVLSTIMQVPPGYFLYHRSLRDLDKVAAESVDTGDEVAVLPSPEPDKKSKS